MFPAAILQPAVLQRRRRRRGQLRAGSAPVIGHEYSHGVRRLRQPVRRPQGNLRNWWTERDRTEFEARADKLVVQYDGYAPFEDANVQGRLTLGENIGDLSGLTMAYRGLPPCRLDADGDGTVSEAEEAPVIDGFTGDQRFFMGWAQVWRIVHREPYLRQLLQVDSHSPGEYRTNGPVSHIDAFYTAFDVEPGDDLYVAPQDRIVLW